MALTVLAGSLCASAGSEELNESQEEDPTTNLDITGNPKIAFIVVGDEFVYMFKNASEQLELSENGVNVSVYGYSRESSINVSYSTLPDELDLGDFDVIVLGSMTAMSFMAESVQPQVEKIVNETKREDAIVIDMGGFGLGTVDLEEHPYLVGYWDNWISINSQRMLTYILIAFCDAEGTIEAPAGIPSNGIYHPDADLPFENITQYIEWYTSDDGNHHVYNPENITIGIPFVVNTNGMIGNNVVNDAVRRLESRGVNVIPAYMHWVLYSNTSDYFEYEGEWIVDAFIDMGSGIMISSGMIQNTEYLQDINVPVINAILFQGTLEEWENSNTGTDYRFHYQIPIMEMGGHIESIVVSGQRYNERYGVMMDEPIPSQMEWLIDRTLNWVNLKHIDNSNRKVALIYYHNSPGRDGAMVANNLDVAPSISILLEEMEERDYNLDNSTPDQDELLELVLKQGRNIGVWAPDELEKIVSTNETELLPVEEYMEMFNQLPENARNDVIDTWGEAPGNVMVYENESGKYFLFPKISMGNILLAPQPTRGASNNTDILYHDQTMPPNHQYIAFYLWLQHKYNADVVIHFGQHGTQEWLKGKGVGLSATEDWPALTIGDMPVVYIYNVGGIAEGVVAKRRGNAVIVDHATPAIVESGLYGNLSNLHQKIHLYTEADQLDDSMKDEYRAGIIEIYNSLGLESDLGTSSSDLAEMTEEEFESFVITGEVHEYLHEISSEYMPYGLHILGQVLEGDELVSMVKSLLGSGFVNDVAKVYENDAALDAAHSPNVLDMMLADMLLNNTDPDTVMQTYLNITEYVSSTEIIGTTITDEQGYYSFDNLSDGSYSAVSVTELSGMGSVFYKKGSHELTISSNGTVDCDIKLEISDEDSVSEVRELAGNSSVSGQAYYISGMNGNRVNTSNASVLLIQQSVISETTTDDDGYFIFTDVSEGEYTVVAYTTLSGMGAYFYKAGENELTIKKENASCEIKLGSSDEETVNSLESQRGNKTLTGQAYYISGMSGNRVNSSDALVVLIKEHKEDAPDTLTIRDDLEKALLYAENLRECSVETSRVLDALEGQYIPPGLGDDPVRSPSVLPSGRNFYSFNPYIVPTEEAWSAGVKLADAFLEEWKTNHGGEYPKKVGFVMWSAETMRHKGIMESEILYLMGMKPVWDDYGNFVDVEAITCEELTHPRIDVVVTMTGVYRETWELQVELMDRAVRKTVALNETDCTWPNYIKEDSEVLYEYLMETGNYTEEQAKILSESRIFGPPSGSWGVGGLTTATGRSDTWDSESDLADLYLRSMSNVYGEAVWGEQHTDLFTQVLSGTEALLFSRSGNDGRGSSGVVFDHVYEFFGGMGMAIRTIDGQTPEMYIVNLKDSADMKTETMAAYLSREMRSTYYNSKWIEGMMNHGYAGAQEFESVLSDLWGLEVTTGAVTDEMWQQLYDIYVTDSYDLGMEEWFNSENPWARQTMLAQMLDATRTEYWDASNEVIQNLANEYQQSMEEYGPCCCALCCGNALLDDYVQGMVTVPGMISETSQQSSSGGSGTGSARVIEASSKAGENSGNQTATSDGGYGLDSSQPDTLHSTDNYVEGKVMQHESTSSDASSSGMSFSGASLIGTLIVVLTFGVIYTGFRRNK
ncbi:cobaltochelatase subunit CobN [Methanolobus sp. WCC1]|uniref:cobaltochelatase subunit CobN n=1 Tax=unclassified Methanolobus TaxID=2629569 RepID=UPI0032488116